ncbi:hypothetical protein Tco_1417007, partial [Tanacetum coccineum]
KLLSKSIVEGPYKYRQILIAGDPTRTPRVPNTTREQIDDELTAAERKQVEADNQAIHILLLGLPVDVYAVVDN